MYYVLYFLCFVVIKNTIFFIGSYHFLIMCFIYIFLALTQYLEFKERAVYFGSQFVDVCIHGRPPLAQDQRAHVCGSGSGLMTWQWEAGVMDKGTEVTHYFLGDSDPGNTNITYQHHTQDINSFVLIHCWESHSCVLLFTKCISSICKNWQSPNNFNIAKNVQLQHLLWDLRRTSSYEPF